MTAGPDVFDLATVYAATYRGPHGGAVHDAPVPEALIAAQQRLASRRQPGETLVEVYDAQHDGAGFGPALQIVTDQAAMLMDSVTVLMHRLGVGYVALMHPTLWVRRDAEGNLLDIRQSAGDGAVEESWIHIQLADTVNRRALAEAVRLLPMVVVDARQVAQDSAALSSSLLELAHQIAADDGTRFPGANRMDVAYLLRWLDVHFVLLGAQRVVVPAHADEGRLRQLNLPTSQEFHRAFLATVRQSQLRQARPLQATPVQSFRFAKDHVVRSCASPLRQLLGQLRRPLSLAGGCAPARRGSSFSPITVFVSSPKDVVPDFSNDLFSSANTSFTDAHSSRKCNECCINSDNS